MVENSLGEIWFKEAYKTFGLTLKIDEILWDENSEFQKIQVFHNKELGKFLVLDGSIMFTEKDEFIYHEMITHVAMCLHPLPEDILIIGGGDGGVLREILKHKEVKKIHLIEIDKKVIETCKRFFPQMTQGFKDKRVIVVNENGLKYTEKVNHKYDVIIVDGIDPFGKGEELFKEKFFLNIKNSLKEDGIFVEQTESPFYHFSLLSKIFKRIRKFFPASKIYTAPMPSYPSGWWSFTLSSFKEIKNLNVEKITEISKKCKFYNLDIHKQAFALPNFLKEIEEG